MSRSAIVSWALLAVITFSSSYSFAQSDDGAQNDEDTSADTTTAPAATPEPGTDSGNSASARASSIGGVAVGAGFFVSAIPGFQLQGFYQLNRDITFGALYSAGGIDLTDSLKDETTVATNEAKLDAALAAVTAQYFFGNSFYLLLGLGQRTVAVSLDLSSTVIDYGLEGKISANTTGLILGIGNQWQFDSGLLIGCEWVGYTMALSSSSSSDIKEKGADAGTVAASQQDGLQQLREDAEDAADFIGRAGTPRLLMFSVGWAF